MNLFDAVEQTERTLRSFPTDHPIVTALACAVPLWAHHLAEYPAAEIFSADAIGSLQERIHNAGEAILFRVPGKTADGFNAIAEAVARLAFCPGGVRCFGMHFEYKPGEFLAGKHGVRA